MSFQAAADGNSLAFVEGPIVGGNAAQGYGSGNEYLASRAPDGGWSQRDLSPEGATDSVYEAFSQNLETAFVSSQEPLSTDAPGYGETKSYEENSYDTLYTSSTAGGAYVPFDTVKPPYREPRQPDPFGAAQGTAASPSTSEDGTCEFTACIDFAGASADYTHLLFEANDALTSASEGRPAAEGGPSTPPVQRREQPLRVRERAVAVGQCAPGRHHSRQTRHSVRWPNERTTTRA